MRHHVTSVVNFTTTYPLLTVSEMSLRDMYHVLKTFGRNKGERYSHLKVGATLLWSKIRRFASDKTNLRELNQPSKPGSPISTSPSTLEYGQLFVFVLLMDFLFKQSFLLLNISYFILHDRYFLSCLYHQSGVSLKRSKIRLSKGIGHKENCSLIENNLLQKLVVEINTAMKLSACAPAD